MKKTFLTIATCLFLAATVFAQNEMMNMGISTPEGNINMGIQIEETPDGGANVNMNIAVPGEQINMGAGAGPRGGHTNVNHQGTVQSQTTVTTTTTTTQSGYYPPQPQQPMQPAQTQGCMYAMNNGDFSNLIASVKKQAFSDDKHSVIKQAANFNCLSTMQVKSLMKEFSFDEDRLEIAKLLYTRTTDRNNYFQVNDAFSFSDSVDELSKYITGQ